MNIGDITKIDETKLTPFTMICGGSPCFPAGTMVATEEGYMPIEEINIGDNVLTHKNRYMPVENIGGNSNKSIWLLKAMGFLDIYATDYHPFYVKRTASSEPEMIPLCDIHRSNYIARPINTNEIDDEYLTDEICWILGRYIADGHIRLDKRKERKNSYNYGVILSIGDDKVDHVKSMIKSYNISCYKHTQSTHRIIISNEQLVRYIVDNGFGLHSYEKQIPQTIINLPINKLKSFLDGYMSGDGCEIKKLGLFSATTVSKNLANDLCDVIQKVYRVGCKVYKDNRPNKTIICGRTVNQRDTYTIRYILDKNRKHQWFEEDDKIWYPVRSVVSTSMICDVYNLEVKEDHTYIAGGAVVSNCQDFSVAGKQAGSKWKCKECGHEYNPLTVHYSERDKCPHCKSTELDKTRSSLLVEWLRMIRSNKPKWGIYENVKNIVGKQFKDTFNMFLEELHEYGYNTYYKVLNAKDYGVPQNRERVFLIIILKELDNGLFEFPEPFDNGLRLKDFLEDEVDEKFYVNTPRAKELIDELIDSGKLAKEFSNSVRGGAEEASTVINGT